MAQKTHSAKRERLSHSGNEKHSGASLAAGLVLGAVIAAYLFITNADPKPFEAYNFINTGLCLWVPLLVIVLVLKRDPSEFGMAVGDRRQGLKWALFLWLAMLPLIVFAGHLPAFREQYLNHRLTQPLAGVGSVFDGAHAHLPALIYYELSMGFYMFCWEFFFRGFLLFGLRESKLGTWGAVILQALPFMLLHWSWRSDVSKPFIEVLGSLPAALILGILAIRTKSFVYGFVAHWGVSMALDVYLLLPFISVRFG